MVLATRSEAGCIRYDLFEQEDDPNKYVFTKHGLQKATCSGTYRCHIVKAIVADVRLSAAPLVVYRLKVYSQSVQACSERSFGPNMEAVGAA